MGYFIEPKDRIYVKGYGFLSFAKSKGTHISNKYGEKLLDTANKSTTDAIKTASKRAIKKSEEATGDLTGNKITDEITNVSKKFSRELQNNKAKGEIEIPEERYISPEKQIIYELRLE